MKYIAIRKDMRLLLEFTYLSYYQTLHTSIYDNTETHYAYNLTFPSILSINNKDMALAFTLHFVI